MSTSKPFVSVLTPTYNRRKFILTSIACFKAQDYPQDRMEWIVLDDGSDKIGDLFLAAGLKNVQYVAIPDGQKLPIGAKRNMLNDMSKGDIIVWWDDDDYYPPTRVKKAVNALRSVPGQRIKVAGCSRINLFFTDRNEIWSIGPYGPNHCTNGTMAYWRSYLQETPANRYDDTAEKSEEKQFLKGFQEPVIQLNPDETMLVVCHADNTYDKRNLIKQNNPLLKKTTLLIKNLIKDKTIRDFYIGLAKDYKE